MFQSGEAAARQNLFPLAYHSTELQRIPQGKACLNPCEKPELLCSVLQYMLGEIGGVCLDLFCGTGSFGTLAPLFRRSSVCVDLDPVMTAAAGQRVVKYLAAEKREKAEKAVLNYFVERVAWQKRYAGEAPPASPPQDPSGSGPTAAESAASEEVDPRTPKEPTPENSRDKTPEDVAEDA